MTRPLIGVDFREGCRAEPRGIGLYCRHISREFAALEAPFDFALYHEREVPAELRPAPAGQRFERVSIPGSRLQLWERVALPLRLQGDGVAVYHGTFNTLPPRIPFRRRPRLVVTVHDLIVTALDEDLDDPWVRYARRATPRVLRQADRILTVSEWSRGEICARFPWAAPKLRVCRNGIAPEFAVPGPERAAERARAKWSDGRPYLFAIGSGLARKNTDALFPLLRALVDGGSCRDEILVVSGLTGPALDARRRSAEAAGILDRVRFTGYLGAAELRDLYAGAELFVYPSRVEGWGIPVLEALACGTPVAASGTSAIPEAGGEHASYFDPGDPCDIHAVVERALAERERFARSAAAARARSFTWREHAGALLAVYDELCA